MRLELALALILAGCGRIGFDAVTDDGGPIDSPAGAAATVTFIGSAFDIADAATFTFPGVGIGPEATNRIVVVSAFLGGDAFLPIMSISVDGTQLALAGEINDSVNGGAIAFGYKTIPTATTATITVASAFSDRAAILVYNVTAQDEAPTESQVGFSPTVDMAAIGGTIDLRAGEIVIANAGHGRNAPMWTWGGTWDNFTERFDNRWTELGTYTTATAAVTADGLRTIQATPSANSAKLFSVATWR